jgi:hypothetical protein
MTEENIETSEMMWTTDEYENANVQIHKFVYDPEILEDANNAVSYRLVIYGGEDEAFAGAMKEFLFALATGKFVGVEQDYDEDVGYVTHIGFKLPLP